MRFLLGGFGSRGDFQPMLALALALRERGHAVTLVSSPDFEAQAASSGVPFVSAGESFQQHLERHAEKGVNLLRLIPEVLRGHFALLEPLVGGVDVLVASPLNVACASLAEKYGKRYHAVWFYPQAFPSSRLGPAHWTPSAAINSQTLPPWLFRVSWTMWRGGWNRLILPKAVAPERERLGLPPVRDLYAHMVFQNALLAADPTLAPLPADVPAVTQTGAWFLPETEGLAPEIEAFLAAGPPPIYVGFGSMPDSRAADTTRRVLEAGRLAGARLLVSRGWARLGDQPLPPTVLAIGSVPHGKLFPRCGAVVHHGGAGTTTAAARAGVPQVVVPHYADQFYWAHRAWTLGLGPPPLPKAKLGGESLGAAMRACLEDPALRRAASEFSARVRTDGIRRAVDILEEGRT